MSRICTRSAEALNALVAAVGLRLVSELLLVFLIRPPRSILIVVSFYASVAALLALFLRRMERLLVSHEDRGLVEVVTAAVVLAVIVHLRGADDEGHASVVVYRKVVIMPVSRL